MNQPGNNFDEWAQPTHPDTAYLPPQGGPAPQAAPVSPQSGPPSGAAPAQFGAQSFGYPPGGGAPPPGQTPAAGYPPPSGMYTPSQPEPKKRSNVALVVISIILGLVLIAALIWAFFQIRGGEEEAFADEPLEVVAAEDPIQDDPAVAVETVNEPAPSPASAPSSSDLSQYGFPAGTSCPSDGRIFTVVQSVDRNTRASICEDSSGNFTYRGYMNDLGLSPSVSAQMYGDNFKATNGSTMYTMWPRSLEVTVNGRTEMVVATTVLYGPRPYDSY